MEPSTAIQILGVIVEAYATVLAIGAGFFTFLMQKYYERIEREDERIREDKDDVETPSRLRKISSEKRRSYVLFLWFFILCFVNILFPLIFMGLAESTPPTMLNFEVWLVEGLASVGFLYIVIFAWFLSHR